MSDPVTACLRGGAPTHLDEGCVLLSRTGERRSVRESVAPVKTKDGEMLGAVLVFQDVTRSRTLQKQLAHSASHDLVTGLANRLAFDRRLQQAARDAREQNRQHAICFLDLDRFKIVNDTAGHAAGDALLRTVGALIRQGHRAHDFTARLGGDEFALLLEDCSIEDALAIAGTLLDEIRTLRFQWDDKVYDIGASVGIAPITSASPRAADLMSQADIACYAAKAAGRNRVSVYDGASSRRPHELAIASSIRRAIESNRFQLFAQELRPLQPGLGDGRHVELLLRMEDESGHLLEPDAFAPAADVERTIVQAIHAIGRELGARTVAAQVEDDETLALVQQVGIDYAQGDAIADARPIDSLLSLVAPYH